MKPENFAKLFEDEKYGQILVMLDTNENGEPCVKIMAQPPGLGVCAFALSFKDEEDAQDTFDHIEIEHAIAGVADLWQFGSEH